MYFLLENRYMCNKFYYNTCNYMIYQKLNVMLIDAVFQVLHIIPINLLLNMFLPVIYISDGLESGGG